MLNVLQTKNRISEILECDFLDARVSMVVEGCIV